MTFWRSVPAGTLAGLVPRCARPSWTTTRLSLGTQTFHDNAVKSTLVPFNAMSTRYSSTAPSLLALQDVMLFLGLVLSPREPAILPLLDWAPASGVDNAASQSLPSCASRSFHRARPTCALTSIGGHKASLRGRHKLPEQERPANSIYVASARGDAAGHQRAAAP